MSTIKEQIKEYLAEEGLRPQEEDYGFYFRYQMLTFIIHWDEEDAFFLRISMPAIFASDENNRGVRAFKADVVLSVSQIRRIVPYNNVGTTNGGSREFLSHHYYTRP